MIDFSRIDAVIFDNDGVLVNSEPLSCGALHDLFLQEFDTEIGHDFSAVIGTSDKYAIQYYANMHGINIDLEDMDRLITTKQDLYFSSAQHNLRSFPNLHQLLERLRGDYQLAVASSGSPQKITFSLEQVGLTEFFSVITSATEVEHGKPAPDLFLLTAERLGVDPNHCVVIEDSVKGIQGAKTAGMSTIGFCSSFPKEHLLKAGAQWCIDDYQELISLGED